METIYQTQSPQNRSSDLLVQTQLVEPPSNVKHDISTGDRFKQGYRKVRYKIFDLLETALTKPIWFSVFIVARFRFVRQIYSALAKLRSPSTEAPSSFDSWFDWVDTTEVVDVLKRDGVYLDFSLPSNILESILYQTKTQNCYAGGRVDMGFKISEKSEVDLIHSRPFYVARYYNISSSWSGISQLAADPKLREIAAKYIGNQAKYTGASLFWTFPVQGESHDSDQQQFQHFHYDIDDFASLRFCFYLSEVDDESGPHLCIRGSHIKKTWFQVINFFSRIQSEADLSKLYHREQFATITGKPGYGFIEDTFCYHRGITPKSKPRLFLQLHFAAHNYNDRNVKYLDYRDCNSLKHFKHQSHSELLL